jgi:hypothetical protein
MLGLAHQIQAWEGVEKSLVSHASTPNMPLFFYSRELNYGGVRYVDKQSIKSNG